jgi:cytochrome c oxidase cbb3-type subunit 3
MKRINLFMAFSILSTSLLFAQEAAETATQTGINPLNLIMYFIAGLLLFVTFILYRVARHLRKFMKGQFATEEEKMYDSRSSWEKIFQLKPVGTDKDTMINEPHDGIYELDNPPPPWFMFLFYGCVVFAIIYMVRFSITKDMPRQEDEYIAEIEEANIAKEARLALEGDLIDESNVVLATAAEDIAAGEALYVKKACAACHGEKLEGKAGLGPNLTDEYWKHGGGVKEVFTTLKYGVLEKGMRAWDGELSPKKMQQVASYVLSMQGTNPPNAKAPEGDKWVPKEEPAETPAEQPQDSSELVTQAN